jgi:uncharacterized membrane protein YccC
MAIVVSLLLVALVIYKIKALPLRQRSRATGREFAAVMMNLRRCYPSQGEAWRLKEAERIMQQRASRHSQR